MKRWICCLLAIALVLGLWGCGPKAAGPIRPVNYYYPRLETDFESASRILVPEPRESQGHEGDYGYLLETYLRGPLDPELKNPFPADLTLERWEITDGTLRLTLSEGIGGLTGIDLSLACACLAGTGLELTGCDRVVLSASGLRGDVELTQADLVLTDDSVERLQDNMILYLTDRDGTCLTARTVAVNLASGNGGCWTLLERLMEGHRQEDLSVPLPKGTEILGVTVVDGICAVNFSGEFENLETDTGLQSLALQCIANTLTGLSYVSGVNFYCEGTRLLHYGGLDTRDPWVYSDVSLGEEGREPIFPGRLYVFSGAGSALVALPVALYEEDPETRANELLERLLTFQSFNGYLSPVPAGTERVRLRITDKVCDLFVTGEQLPETAVNAITATLCSLPEIERVNLLVEEAAADAPA